MFVLMAMIVVMTASFSVLVLVFIMAAIIAMVVIMLLPRCTMQYFSHDEIHN